MLDAKDKAFIKTQVDRIVKAVGSIGANQATVLDASLGSVTGLRLKEPAVEEFTPAQIAEAGEEFLRRLVEHQGELAEGEWLLQADERIGDD